MQLRTSKQPLLQPNSVSNPVLENSVQEIEQRSKQVASVNTDAQSPNGQQHLPICYQLAQANQFGHHLRQFHTYSQAGYSIQYNAMQCKAAVGRGRSWHLQRYPDRSVEKGQDSEHPVFESSAMQTSEQPVQFIFGWVLRKMVNKTMRWLFPKPK